MGKNDFIRESKVINAKHVYEIKKTMQQNIFLYKKFTHKITSICHII